MDYSSIIRAVIVFVENNLETEKDYGELEKSIGFSLSHIRSVFAKSTGQSLSKYILSRKIAKAAFDIVHTGDSILDISIRYSFNNPDTFTRAFSRCTGFTPQQFRKERPTVGRTKLYDSIYGVSERIDSMNNEIKKTADSTVLYGVPKARYGAYGGCTPYPICVKSVANYLGDDIDYSDIMVISGTAFRLTWDVTGWFGGNVDICFTFDEYDTPYRLAVEGLGRKFNGTPRTDDSPEHKQEFIALIKKNIDAGIPCIAMGIIGPPEACIITGYRDDGNTLLGWNMFQDRPEFTGSDVTIDESGYFVTSAWWENGFEQIVTLSEEIKERLPLKKILGNAIEVLSGRQKDQFAKGILAYDAWKKAIVDDSQFPENAVTPLLVERLMCQGDAMDCIADGRGNAKIFFEKLAVKHPEQALYGDLAKQFGIVFSGIEEMCKCLGGWDRSEVQLNKLADRNVRQEICRQIELCKSADEKALDLMKELYSVL